MAETGTENIDKLSEEARKAKDNLASFAAQLGLGKPSISGAVKSFGKLGASASTAAKFLENQVGQYQTLRSFHTPSYGIPPQQLQVLA